MKGAGNSAQPRVAKPPGGGADAIYPDELHGGTITYIGEGEEGDQKLSFGKKRPNADHALWALAAELAKAGEARALWLGILDIGSAVCKATPRCDECPLADDCCYAASR